jgi:hypothetical protein
MDSKPAVGNSRDEGSKNQVQNRHPHPHGHGVLKLALEEKFLIKPRIASR